ncbi:hypothetical protein SteCoe_1929 [Stentor coeruleus]|uniref:Uncharacterized protein n=1 Tax=Stentor coeruleus TaxID=5963 RepID=A0A1R2D0K4_9CILI|nr:hypothetical protein SteCoe_1929 [Stentor coeruleus]
MESKSLCCAIYCFTLSVISTIFLSILAIVLVSGYDYIKIENKDQGGETCFWTAVIYMGISILCFIYIKRRRNRLGLRASFEYQAEQL